MLVYHGTKGSDFMSIRYPNSLFKILGVSKEIGLKAIGKSKLTSRQLNILYKRFGEGYDGTKIDPKEKLLSDEARDLRKIISIVSSHVNTLEDCKTNSVLIEHREEVNKYLNDNRNDIYIALHFPMYNLFRIKPVILYLYKKATNNLGDYNLLENFIHDNKEMILEHFKKLGIEPEDNQKLKSLDQNNLLFRVLQNIRDKNFPGVTLEELVIAGKIFMIKNKIKSYDNCISLLNYILENRFGVFRILKLGLSKENYSTINSILYLTNDKGDLFLNVEKLIEKYNEGINNGLERNVILEILGENFRISPKLVEEILLQYDYDIKLTTGGGRD